MSDNHCLTASRGVSDASRSCWGLGTSSAVMPSEQASIEAKSRPSPVRELCRVAEIVHRTRLVAAGLSLDSRSSETRDPMCRAGDRPASDRRRSNRPA